MLTNAFVQQLSAELEALRGNGRDLFLFDTRDHGNYSDYNLERDWLMLERTDPTGFAAAMLLDEMIEATICGSNFAAARVLREDGFLEQARKILGLKARLTLKLAAPREAFMAKVSQALTRVFGTPADLNTRQVAIVLRDALFSLDRGLTLSWLRCEPAVPGPLALADTVLHYPDMPTFLHALQYELPFGAYLVCLKHQDTVLGFKQPGRTAYLSRFAINSHSGQLKQNVKSGSNLAERFDLGEPSERFPDWTPARSAWERTRSWDSSRHPEPSATSPHTKLADLPQDTVLWAALLTEMMRQRLATVAPETVTLTESLVRALPNRTAQLPVVRPNYTLSDLPLQAAFDALGLTDPWLVAFVKPALQDISLKELLPLGEVPLALNLDTLALRPWPDRYESGILGRYEDFKVDNVAVTPLSEHLVGTREDLETLREQLLARNMAQYLTAWVNRKIATLWLTELHDWFRAAVEKRLPDILCHPLIAKTHVSHYGPIHFYKQSPKHKTFRAKCWFSPKLDPDARLVITANDSTQLAEMLGLPHAALPTVLQGWKRLPDQGTAGNGKFEAALKWAWNDLSEAEIHPLRDRLKNSKHCAAAGFLVAQVSVNLAAWEAWKQSRANH